MSSAFRKRNLVALLFTGFVSYWEWAVIMASIYPYIQKVGRGDSSLYLALAQSSFPLGQGLSLPLASWLVKRLSHVKGVLLLMILLAMVGNVCYVLADSEDLLVLIVLGRALAGVGAGSGGIAYGCIAANTKKESRVKLVMVYRVVCMTGIILATLASAALLPRFCQVTIGKLQLSENTSPAAWSFVLLTLALCLVILLFDDNEVLTAGTDEPDGTHIKELLRSRTVHLVFLLFLLTGYMTTWVAYVMPLVVFDSFDWTIAKFGWLLLGVSCTAVIGSFGAAYLSRTSLFTNNGEWKVTVFSCCLQLVGVFLCLCGSQNIFHQSPFNVRLIFIAGTVLIFFAYSVCGLVLPLLANKTTRKSAMAALMPYCVASMSAGKVLAPLVAKSELVIQGWLLVYVATAGFIVLVLFLFPFLYRKLERTPLLSNSTITDVSEQTSQGPAPCNSQRESELDSSLSGSLPSDTFTKKLLSSASARL